MEYLQLPHQNMTSYLRWAIGRYPLFPFWLTVFSQIMKKGVFRIIWHRMVNQKEKELNLSLFNWIPTYKLLGLEMCVAELYGMPKWYLFNSQNIMQLSKYRSTLLNISRHSQNNMQLRKSVYFLGTCTMNSEKLWVLVTRSCTCSGEGRW